MTGARIWSLSRSPTILRVCACRAFRSANPSLRPHTPEPEPAIDNAGLLHRTDVLDFDTTLHRERDPTQRVDFETSERLAKLQEAAKRARKVWKARHVSGATVIESSMWEPCEFKAQIDNVKPFEQSVRGLGVLDHNKDLDLKIMVSNYTAPVLAAGLRDREETLQLCARLLADRNITQLQNVLHPYQEGPILKRRRKQRILDLSMGLQNKHLNMLRKYLHRAPRQLTRAVSLRASVVIPLCNVDGVACILFEHRSNKVKSFKNQVCFPGGMVEETMDVNIMETSLREMEEEIGVSAKLVDVLGVLRCDWSEVAKITGIGVTPVVGFLGDLAPKSLQLNPNEVAEVFTIPLYQLLDKSNWLHDEEKVVFTASPHLIWGLTAYILERFLKDILLRYKIDS